MNAWFQLGRGNQLCKKHQLGSAGVGSGAAEKDLEIRVGAMANASPGSWKEASCWDV